MPSQKRVSFRKPHEALPVSEAECPAGISSFFEIVERDSAGSPLTDPAKIGARGGGFGIIRGVSARVNTRKSSHTRINIRINSKPAPAARTTRWAIREILKTRRLAVDVDVHLKIRVPIGAGFGTSAAGTLASCLALADAADIPMTMNDVGRITHVAEVVNKTGLGTASALLTGGFVLVTEPGAPGVGSVDRLMFPEHHSILCAYLGPIPTRGVLAQSNIASKVNPAARQVMDKVRKKPDLYTFLREARRFSESVGFQTPNVARLVEAMISTGAIGATQNMIGEAVHGVVPEERAKRAVEKLRKAFPSARVFLSHLDDRGVRPVDAKNPKHLNAFR